MNVVSVVGISLPDFRQNRSIRGDLLNVQPIARPHRPCLKWKKAGSSSKWRGCRLCLDADDGGAGQVTLTALDWLTMRRLTVKITDVQIRARNEDRLKALATITFDDSFVVRGCRVIQGTKGYFVSMPSQELENGMYRDIAHPIDAAMRNAIQETVIRAYVTETEANKG